MGIVVIITACCCSGCKHNNHEHYFSELSPLGNAARHQNLAGVQTLLTRGADVNVREKNGETALYDALECGEPNCDNVLIIDALLDRGADVNTDLPWWGTPLTFSLTRDYGSQAATLELIRRGAQVSKTCNGEDTDVSLATQNFELEVVEALLERGADPNCKNSHGASALYWAQLNHRDDAVRLLQRYGAKTKENVDNLTQ